MEAAAFVGHSPRGQQDALDAAALAGTAIASAAASGPGESMLQQSPPMDFATAADIGESVPQPSSAAAALHSASAAGPGESVPQPSPAVAAMDSAVIGESVLQLSPAAAAMDSETAAVIGESVPQTSSAVAAMPSSAAAAMQQDLNGPAVSTKMADAVCMTGLRISPAAVVDTSGWLSVASSTAYVVGDGDPRALTAAANPGSAFVGDQDSCIVKKVPLPECVLDAACLSPDVGVTDAVSVLLLSRGVCTADFLQRSNREDQDAIAGSNSMARLTPARQAPHVAVAEGSKYMAAAGKKAQSADVAAESGLATMAAVGSNVFRPLPAGPNRSVAVWMTDAGLEAPESAAMPAPSAASSAVKVSLTLEDSDVSTTVARGAGRNPLRPLPPAPASPVESSSAGLGKAAAASLGIAGQRSTESAAMRAPGATRSAVKVFLNFEDSSVSTTVARGVGRKPLLPLPSAPASPVESSSARFTKVAVAASSTAGQVSTESAAKPAACSAESMEMATARTAALSTADAEGSTESGLVLKAAILDSADMGPTQEAAAVAAGESAEWERSVKSGRSFAITAARPANYALEEAADFKVVNMF